MTCALDAADARSAVRACETCGCGVQMRNLLNEFDRHVARGSDAATTVTQWRREIARDAARRPPVAIVGAQLPHRLSNSINGCDIARPWSPYADHVCKCACGEWAASHRPQDSENGSSAGKPAHSAFSPRAPNLPLVPSCSARWQSLVALASTTATLTSGTSAIPGIP